MEVGFPPVTRRSGSPLQPLPPRKLHCLRAVPQEESATAADRRRDFFMDNIVVGKNCFKNSVLEGIGGEVGGGGFEGSIDLIIGLIHSVLIARFLPCQVLRM